MLRSVLGLDIGGANLKAAHAYGAARCLAFPLWKKPGELADALRILVASLGRHDLMAITMTGELCDCYESKRHGVLAILEAAAAACGDGPAIVWRNDGRFVRMADARADPLPAAAANWLALATFAGRWASRGPGLLIDVGSTTTDLVPLLDGRPIPRGRTDPERLRLGELVYSGVRRTPVCALLGRRGAAELFATMLDVYLLLGDRVEDASDCDTADGRPATREAAWARLARMDCADSESCTADQARELAARISRRQVRAVGAGLRRVLAALPRLPRIVVVAGTGEFLARRVVASVPALDNADIISLASRLSPELSATACAYAVATLAAESKCL